MIVMGTWDYMGLHEIWGKSVLVFGPATIPMDHITVVSADLPSDRLNGLL